MAGQVCVGGRLPCLNSSRLAGIYFFRGELESEEKIGERTDVSEVWWLELRADGVTSAEASSLALRYEWRSSVLGRDKLRLWDL